MTTTQEDALTNPVEGDAVTPSLQTGGEGLAEADAEIARIMALSDEEVLAETTPEDLAWVKLFRARMIAIKHALPGRYDGISTYATIRGDADEKPYMMAIRDALTPSGGEGETVPGDEWVMVPREPTEAMLKHGCCIPGISLETGRRMYRALLAVSPKQAPVKGEPA